MREKLIELLGADVCIHTCCTDCEYGDDRDACIAFLKKAMADHLIANSVTIQQWIPVTDRLPERNRTVLVIDRVTGQVDTAYLNFCDSFVFHDGRGHGASH